MKTFLISLFIVLSFAFNANSQTFSEKKSSRGFNVENSTKTKESITVNGIEYTLYQTAKGAKFILALSEKDSKPYPIWVGDATNLKHKGLPVRVFKSGSYAVFVMGMDNYPHAKYLELNK